MLSDSAREVKNAAREQKRTTELHALQMKRAETIITEATSESAAKVLQHPDVVDIVCGPLQSKLRQLQRQLAEEKALHRQTKRYVYITYNRLTAYTHSFMSSLSFFVQRDDQRITQARQ